MIARRYTTMDWMVGKSIATEKFRAVLLSSFAGVRLLLVLLLITALAAAFGPGWDATPVKPIAVSRSR